MGSPLSALLVLTLYLLIVRHGTSFVHSPPSKGHRGRHSTSHLFDIGHFANKSFFSYLLVLYNLAMAALNAWIAFEVTGANFWNAFQYNLTFQLIYCGIKRRYNFLCQLVYPEMDDPYETRVRGRDVGYAPETNLTSFFPRLPKPSGGTLLRKALN